MKPLVAQAGDWIFEAGEHGKDMYILVHGVVEFCRKGTIDPYSIVEAPNCFGEAMAFGLVRLSSFAVIIVVGGVPTIVWQLLFAFVWCIHYPCSLHLPHY